MQLPSQVLMASAQYFEVRDVKNEFMRGNVGGVNRAQALAQWDALRSALESHGVRVHVIPALPECEDMVFTANPSFNGVAAGGERICVPSRMAFGSRRAEVAAHVAWFAARGYNIVELPQDVRRFEGGGDALWHPGRALIWAGAGPRTERSAHDALARIFGVPVASLDLVDPRFYHLDTCFCAVNERTVLVFASAFTQEGLERIRESFSDAIEVDEEEATRYLACNAATFADNVVVIRRGAQRTIRELERRGLTVVQVETGEFLKSGGSVFCMKAGVY